jgi:hypothetical protein
MGSFLITLLLLGGAEIGKLLRFRTGKLLIYLNLSTYSLSNSSAVMANSLKKSFLNGGMFG